MNIDFEAALKYIDLGNYERAVEKLNSAIAAAGENTDEEMQYRCVLGELYANMGIVNRSQEEFVRVMKYTEDSTTLPKQRAIAQAYLDAFAGKTAMPKEQMKRPGDAPLVPKPRQDAAFIAKQSRKHR
ncbi:MAG: hypothetical protein MR291_09080 [Oscillospiraceae bacterium]|nr:hypothetical protein [Oscillospiraceae bacterium]